MDVDPIWVNERCIDQSNETAGNSPNELSPRGSRPYAVHCATSTKPQHVDRRSPDSLPLKGVLHHLALPGLIVPTTSPSAFLIGVSVFSWSEVQ